MILGLDLPTAGTVDGPRLGAPPDVRVDVVLDRVVRGRVELGAVAGTVSSRGRGA